MKSIIDNEKQCLVCGSTGGLHKHHIFFGTSNRKLSEQYGCWCYLCGRHHNLSNVGVHSNRQLDINLKQHAQKRFNLVYPDLDFREIFGKSYL